MIFVAAHSRRCRLMPFCRLNDIFRNPPCPGGQNGSCGRRTSFTQTMSHNMTTDLRDRITAKHEAAVTAVEARRLALALAPFGVLSRQALLEQAGAHHWRDGSFEQAIRAAAQAGAIEELPGQFYREAR